MLSGVIAVGAWLLLLATRWPAPGAESPGRRGRRTLTSTSSRSRSCSRRASLGLHHQALTHGESGEHLELAFHRRTGPDVADAHPVVKSNAGYMTLVNTGATDVILVGEMRDLETIRLALTAAETGHLVFGTLHTTSAAKTIDRVIDVFPAAEKTMVRSMLSESLRGVIAQLLLRKADGKGRVAAVEVMISNQAIKNLIREEKTYQILSVMQTGKAQGMQTMENQMKFLVENELVTEDEVAAYLKETE